MAEIIPIDDPDDPRLAPYRQVRERDLVGRQGRFIAEGEVVLRVLARARHFAAESALVAAKRLAKLRPVLEALGADLPVYAAAPGVIDVVAGFHLHRGVLAVGVRPTDPSAETLLAAAPAQARVLALFGVANHDNIGGIFRNAAAFGAHAVLLDGACCDPLYRKAIRVSVGGVLTTPFARLPSDVDALELLSRHAFEVLALSPSGVVSIDAVRAGGRTAILLGTEGAGLPRPLLERARSVRIPMAQGFDSLNVATASGIVLHHLAANRA